ncbi:Uma2 family endonuclease [Nocardia sp. MDA0666]|uniref:Uma2 family endonuclease n=1 Tax=Nocardia sp. MDA0666 TaxID=2135448 RepID=UPI000D126CD3|nr:Uma2 family endonuclease [Nocardia sp. MDA0666]PSR66849.1 Uma2 family endonuclease [Nocardia sp. MDA0666]
MSAPQARRPKLPEHLTWDELSALPDEIVERIELWDGRVVWTPHCPSEHHEFTNLLWNRLRTCVKALEADPEQCWRVSTGTSVFFGCIGMSDFVTPDFMIYRCLPEPYQYVRSDRVVLVGEVLTPSNSDADTEAKKARYARAGIPWYWEVTLATHRSEIAHIHAYTLIPEVKPPDPGIPVLHRANYVLAGAWFPADAGAATINHPFPISIPWSELEF